MMSSIKNIRTSLLNVTYCIVGCVVGDAAHNKTVFAHFGLSRLIWCGSSLNGGAGWLESKFSV